MKTAEKIAAEARQMPSALAKRLASQIGPPLRVSAYRNQLGRCLRAFSLILLLVCSAEQSPLAQGESTATSEQDKKAETNSCESRLTNFVSELDRVLEENPRSIRPLEQLLASYFPIHNCSIEAARKIARTSKFFESADDQVAVVVFVFSSARFVGSAGFATRGFYVSFGINKNTGNSWLPFVKINM